MDVQLSKSKKRMQTFNWEEDHVNEEMSYMHRI
jgi:hypothetical protein